MSNLDDSGLDLEKLFLPAWAQQSADVNKYADFAGYADNDKVGGRGMKRRSAPFGDRPPRAGGRERSGGSGWGAGRPERPERKEGGPERRERPFRSSPQGSEGGRVRGEGAGGGRRQRPGGGAGGGAGRRDFRGPRRDEPRRPLPPLPEVDVQLVPEPIVVETLAKQIRQSGRAYPLFEIAHIILKRPERLEVAYSVIKKGNQVAQPLFFCSMDRTLWLSEEEAMEHVLKNHFANFYETQKVPIEGPKGTYTFVAQCGMSGEVLGPPNLHDYQNKICKIHSEKFSHLPFDVYKSRIKIVRDEAVIEKWREEMSFTLHYNCLQVPEPLELQDMSSLREHFRQTHLASVIQSVETVTLSLNDVRKQPNHLISVLYRRLLEEQKRFPLKLVMVLSQKFAAHTLQFFKVNKTVTHVCVSRPHYLDMDTTSVSENVKNIMGYVVAHPGCKRADIYKALVPGYTEATAASPQSAEAAAAAAVVTTTSPEPVPAPAETVETPAETPVEGAAVQSAEAAPAPAAESVKQEPAALALPPEVLAGLANLNADLHWLIQCGHVIEYYKGNIEAAPKKIMPPSAKPKAKKKETKAAEGKPAEAKKAATPAETEAPAAEVEVKAEAAEVKAEETPAEVAPEVTAPVEEKTEEAPAEASAPVEVAEEAPAEVTAPVEETEESPEADTTKNPQ